MIKRMFTLASMMLVFFTIDVAAGEETSKHSLTLQYQDFDDETVITQSFTRTGLLYRYQVFQKLGLDLEYSDINGDRSGSFYRLGASGSMAMGPVDLNYGFYHYQQELDDFAGDSTDSGLKLMLGLGYQVKQFHFDLNYISEDVEGADPDDPGDYVEMGSLELSVRYDVENSPWSVGFSYVDSGSDYTANTLRVGYSF